MALYFGIERTSYAWRIAAVRVSYGKPLVERVWSVPRTSFPDVATLPEGETPMSPLSPLASVVGPNDAVAIALSGDLVTTKRLVMPAGVQKQLKEALPFELEGSLPFDLEGHVWDAQLVRSDAESLRVFVAVARESDVRDAMSQGALWLGTEPERVALGACALAQVVPSPGVSRAVIYLAHGAAELLVLADGRVAHYAQLAGDSKAWTREVRVALSSYAASGMAAPESLAVLTANPDERADAQAWCLEVASAVGLRAVDISDVSVQCTPGAEASVKAQLLDYALPVGLALELVDGAKSLNFRQGPLKYERGFGWLGARLPVLVPLAAVAALALVVSSVAHVVAVSRQRDMQREVLAAETRAVFSDETKDPAAARALLAAVGAKLAEDPMPHADALDLMVRIAEALPASVKMDLEELDLKKGHIGVTAIVDSVSDAETFAKSLGEKPCFRDVKVVKTNQVVGGERKKFVLEGEMRCPEDERSKKPKPSAAAPAPEVKP